MTNVTPFRGRLPRSTGERTHRRPLDTRFLAILLAGFFVLACPPVEEEVVEEPPAVEPSIGDERALNALVADFIVAINESDADGAAALYASDAVRMPPDAPAVRGREAIRQNLEAAFENADIEVQTHVEETEFSGELASVRGTFALTAAPKGSDAASTEIQGNWMRLMRREPDGHWLVARELWNTDS